MFPTIVLRLLSNRNRQSYFIPFVSLRHRLRLPLGPPDQCSGDVAGLAAGSDAGDVAGQIDKIFSGTQHPAFLCQNFIERNIGGVILPVVATEVPDKLLSILAHASLEDPTF